MGSLRFFLATSVVAWHAQSFPIPLLPGNMAVETFFVISGFYMSMILRTKYRERTGAFYLNRALRLYPVYLSVLLLVWAWYATEFLYLGHRPAGSILPSFYAHMSWWQNALIACSNLSIFGQDVLPLLNYKIGTGFLFMHASPYDATMTTYIGDATDGAKWVGEFQNIFQAWSLGTELWFYALAPLLVRARSWIVLALAIASFMIRWYMWDSFFMYYFFPADIGFFLVGVMADRWPLGISRLFAATKDLAWDTALGNLSYPVYLCHGLVISVLATLHCENAYVVGALTLALSVLIYNFVESPIERLRARIASTNTPVASIAPTTRGLAR